MIIRVIDWIFLLEPAQGIFYLCTQFMKKSNANIFRAAPRICAKVYLCSMCIAKDEKTKIITNPFLWSIDNAYYEFIQACV